MKLRSRLAAAAATAVLASSLAACAVGPRTRFDGYGNVDAAKPHPALVANARDVQVFYGTSPAGFSLRENELKVEPGHQHQILGTVRVTQDKNTCMPLDTNKKAIIEAMRETARANGGNAVIYAVSSLPDQPSTSELCENERSGDLGSGWVVILEATPPAAAPTATAAPVPPPAAPAAAQP